MAHLAGERRSGGGEGEALNTSRGINDSSKSLQPPTLSEAAACLVSCVATNVELSDAKAFDTQSSLPRFPPMAEVDERGEGGRAGCSLQLENVQVRCEFAREQNIEYCTLPTWTHLQNLPYTHSRVAAEHVFDERQQAGPSAVPTLDALAGDDFSTVKAAMGWSQQNETAAQDGKQRTCCRVC